MRGNIRSRKNCTKKNKKSIIALVVLILILMAILFTFGIKNISHNKVPTEIVGKNEIQEEKPVPKDTTINLVAIGDIMCHKTNYKAAYNSETKKYDFTNVFVNVAKYITKADIAIRKPRDNICR